ncbi:MAG: amidase [Rhodobacteraceae bacterium]|nr:amidase [Paracoccaceae bacterium]
MNGPEANVDAATPDDPLRAADARLRLFTSPDRAALIAGDRVDGPLAGWSVGLKDNIAVARLPWTAGIGHRSGLCAPRDAHVTAALRAAGADLAAGLMMDEAALGGTTDNPYFGRTDNPLAPGYSAGGSSGGSAAAVAAGVLRAALGTDTLGSVRIPASYCGVVGLKPTAGLIGRSGILPLAPSFDTVGPIAASIADIWPLLAVLAGPDPDDSDSRPAPPGWDEAPPPEALRVGIAVPGGATPCAPEVAQALQRAATALGEAGVTVATVETPGWRPAALRRAAFVITECEAAVALADAFDRGLSAGVSGMLAYGRSLGAGKMVRALDELRRARAEIDRAFGRVDVLLTPTTAHLAPRADQPPPEDQADFTALANATGLPALALPVPGQGPLPASVQLIGRAWGERGLLALGAVIEAAAGAGGGVRRG